MSQPLGVALVAQYTFKKSGVLTDPSPLPTTVTGSLYPDGTAGPTPALTHVSAGVFQATVFTALLNTLIGTYDSWVYVSDTTLDSPMSEWGWIDVGVNNLTAIAGTPQTAGGDVGEIDSNLEAVKLQTDALPPLLALVTLTGVTTAATSTTFTLPAGYADLSGQTIEMTSGAGAKQVKVVKLYDTVTGIATLATPWAVTPTAGDTYVLYIIGRSLLVGTAPGGSVDTTTFSGAAATQMNEIQTRVDTLNGSAQITMIAPVLSQANIPIVAGRAYKLVYGNELTFSITNLGVSLQAAGVSVKLNVQVAPLPAAAQVFTAVITGAQTGYFELADADTATWGANSAGYDAEIVVLDGLDVVDIQKRKFPVLASVG